MIQGRSPLQSPFKKHKNLEEVHRTREWVGDRTQRGQKSLGPPNCFHHHIFKFFSLKNRTAPQVYHTFYSAALLQHLFMRGCLSWTTPYDLNPTQQWWILYLPVYLELQRDYTPAWGKTLPAGMRALFCCTDGLWQTWEQIWKHSATGRTSRKLFFFLLEHPRYLFRSESVVFL